MLQEPFDAVDFVERLAWRLTGSNDDVDVIDLKTKFEEEIGNLQMLSDQFQVLLSLILVELVFLHLADFRSVENSQNIWKTYSVAVCKDQLA